MMKHIFPLLIALIVFSTSCDLKNAETKHDSNAHMNKTSFEGLVTRFEDSTRYKWQKPAIILRKLGELNEKTVVDIGAGTGYFSLLMAEAGATVFAHDIDQRFLDYIDQKKNHPNIQTQQTPEDDPLIENESADLVLVVNTYHHIQDREVYFNKVYQGLKPGGKLFIVDFKKEKSVHGPPIEMRVSGLSVLKELQSAGFSKAIIDVSSLSEQYIVSAKK